MTLATIALHEPVTVSGLAVVLGRERNAVSHRVTQLVQAGLVQRTYAPAERRVYLRLTPAGTAALVAGDAES